MGAITLELRCPQSVGGVVADPQVDWSFDTLLSELNAIETKLNVSPVFPSPFTKTVSREVSAAKDIAKGSKGFVMHVSDDEMDDMESDVVRKEGHGVGRRFACDELYLSDSEDSEDESAQLSLMDRVGLVEGALIELNYEHQLSDTEEIRNQISAFEADLMCENEKFTSALFQVEKYTEAQREMDRKLDMQYHRRIAEALDNHLTAVQRDHENKSQIEERKIRDDAAFEEAKRKEKAFREEKLRQEKMKAEAEARLQATKKRDEEAKAAALEAERAAKQAAELVANETQKQVASMGTTGPKKEQSPGNILKGADKALKMEERRLQIYKELASKNEAFGLSSNTEYRRHGNEIARRIKTINGTKENVRAKADELIKIFNSSCPQSISIVMFAKKVISHCVNPTGSFNNAMYAYCHVIVMVTSQVPLAMEILLAELNRACIFTVPKYIIYSESKFGSKEAYNKAIGYDEEDGKIESTNSYVGRLSSYMKLYGALVQTEVDGFSNLHGIKEGWTWLACFLNALPANYYTAVALQAFLEMSGYALYKRYKEQFRKLLDVIYGKFLDALKGREDPPLKKVVMSVKNYLEMKQFLEEPEGRQLQSCLLSREFVPGSESEQQQQQKQKQQYYPSSDRQQHNLYSSRQEQYYPSSDRQQYNQYSSRFRYQR